MYKGDKLNFYFPDTIIKIIILLILEVKLEIENIIMIWKKLVLRFFDRGTCTLPCSIIIITIYKRNT